MQTEKEISEIKRKTAGFKNVLQERNAHFVFITGELGIHPVFDLVKTKLQSEYNSCLTLIYFTSANLSQPLYKAELENLEKRFPSKLITHYLFTGNQNCPENRNWHQQILEIVINSNTRSVMEFLILGTEEFIETVTDHLHFLSIHSNHIYSQII